MQPMAEEIQEIHEHAEEAHHDQTLAPVTITMSVLAVLVAVVSLLGHRAHTEEVLLQNKATDQWNFYQAKNIRRHSYEMFVDRVRISTVRDAEQARAVSEKYEQEIKRYKGELTDLQKEAQRLEQEESLSTRRSDRFDLGEVLLEAALVITSITLLTGKRGFWFAG